jgi:tyrosyl-tRNA synthetase
MSKSLGNYVAVEDPPFEMFGKLMSVSDELMWKYWLLLTDRSEEDIADLRREADGGRRHPMEIKKELARTIVEEFQSPEAAEAAQNEFERVFSERSSPSDIPLVELAVDGPVVLLSKVLVQGGLATSNSEARRLMQQGGVKVDGEAQRDPKAELDTGSTEPLLVQVGKRKFARVSFRK